MSDEWERLGRELLRYELEEHGEAVATAFRDASTQLDRGADLEEVDTGRLRVRVEQALAFLDIVEEASNAD